jgi:hypothetical protein
MTLPEMLMDGEGELWMDDGHEMLCLVDEGADGLRWGTEVRQRQDIERVYGPLRPVPWPEGLTRRYTYSERHTIEQWAQFGTIIVDKFLRYCTEQGAPGGAVHRVVGLRFNFEGTRDQGELLHRIECDPKDPRTVEIKLCMSWLA